MSHSAHSLIKETSATTGTGDYTLAGALSGFVTFASGITSGTDAYVPYVATMGTNYEVGIGRLSASTTLQRVIVLESSNANAAVSWAAGDKIITCQTGALSATLGRHKFDATIPPAGTDNYAQGYGPGSLWVHGALGTVPVYVCINPGTVASPTARWAMLASDYALSAPKTGAGVLYGSGTTWSIADEAATWSGGQQSYGSLSVAGYGARFYHEYALYRHANDPTNAYTKTGVAQSYSTSVVGTTTNATPTVIYVNNDSGDGNLVIPPSCTQYVTVKIVARQPTTSDSKVWTLELVCQRIGTADLALIGSVTKTTVQASAGASAWDVATQFNNTLDSLEIKVTGEASKTISWYALVEAVHNGDGE